MSEATLHCANHPDRETTLRCNHCDKPICSRCAVRTPVGYRCRECVRGQQSIFETARTYDYATTAVISGIGVGLAVLLLNILGFWGLLLAPVIGGGIAEVVRVAVRRRRAVRLPLAAAIGGTMGVLPYVVFALLPILQGPGIRALGATLLSLVWPVAFGVLMISALYYRLRGIRL